MHHDAAGCGGWAFNPVSRDQNPDGVPTMPNVGLSRRDEGQRLAKLAGPPAAIPQ